MIIRLYSLLQPWIRKHRWLRALLRTIAARLPGLVQHLHQDQKTRYQSLSSNRQQPVLLYDVTHMSQTDLNTGIQRVVNSVYSELKSLLPSNTTVEPIQLTCDDGFWHFRYYDLENRCALDEVVVPRQGDIFLGIDLNAVVTNPIHAGLFADWRKRGAKIVFTVHDILPITHPHWWHNGVKEGHEAWLRGILTVSDIILSVSQTTQNEVLKWAKTHQVETKNIEFSWFHLGADFIPSRAQTTSSDTTLQTLQSKPSFLLVSTIEPRKGHQQCLEAFSLLWRAGHDIQLAFVGKEGWKTDQLIQQITQHPEFNHRLFWFNGISDSYLQEVYHSCTCLLQASQGEGFGLPLIEGAQAGLPIIARDIPIFREVANDNAFYFTGTQPCDLAEAIKQWLVQFEQGTHIRSHELKWNDWRESTSEICRLIKIDTLNKSVPQ